jgi:hypothetical protein
MLLLPPTLAPVFRLDQRGCVGKAAVELALIIRVPQRGRVLDQFARCIPPLVSEICSDGAGLPASGDLASNKSANVAHLLLDGADADCNSLRFSAAAY